MLRLIIRVAPVLLGLAIQLSFIALGGASVGGAADSEQVSVTGDATFVVPANGNTVRYSFSAIQHLDGTVSGEFQTRAETPTGELLQRSHVTIVCLAVTGNIARIGGVVDRSTLVPPGTEGYITVVDNGEGANDTPDLASPIGVGPGTAMAHCETGLPRPLFPVESGNIQVRPSGL